MPWRCLLRAVSSWCGGRLNAYHTQEAVWEESRHRVWSIPRWGLVVNVYISLILILVGSLGGSELCVRQQGLSWEWLVWKRFGKGRFAEVIAWHGIVQSYPTITGEYRRGFEP